MPHEWRLPARSAVSPRACATDSPPEIPSAIAGAFADRAPIDWTALIERIDDAHGRAALQALRRLDELRGRPRDPVSPPVRDLGSVVLGLLVVLGAFQTACGLARAAATILSGDSIGGLTSHLLVSGTFAVADPLLAPAAPRDPPPLLRLPAV